MQHKRIARQPRWHVMVSLHRNTHSKVHGANMGPIWGRQDPGGPNVGPMNCYLGRPCFAGSSIIVHVLTNTKSMANLNIHLWRHYIRIAITNFIHCISHYKEHDQMGHPCKKNDIYISMTTIVIYKTSRHIFQSITTIFDAMWFSWTVMAVKRRSHQCQTSHGVFEL